ncbi:MAG: hypothetical protein JXC32_14360 [Anaerolineae bacterium]|nr:hypothetical protein [Anaerolineae bacterium]
MSLNRSAGEIRVWSSAFAIDGDLEAAGQASLGLLRGALDIRVSATSGIAA